MKLYLITLFSFSFLLFLVFGSAESALAQKKTVTLQTITEGQKVNGFRAEGVYLNDSDQPMGARFVHERTGFILDFLEIQSVPQAYIWVNSFPISDRGESHTQEHLLLIKGNKGRNLNGKTDMSMAGSTASTYKYYTVYGFDSQAGNSVFFDLFESYFDAMLHPDYTDEEIRREVRNWGVTENADKTLRLEEKGTVYNEMTSSSSRPGSRIYDRLERLLYGEGHPLSFSAGGRPEGIREMTADHIKSFRESNYHLGNMGAVVSAPKSMPLGELLSQINTIFNKLEPGSKKRNFMTTSNMPPFHSAEPGKMEVVEYPSENEKEPGDLVFAYLAGQNMDNFENVLLGNFISTFAGDANTNLYKKFVDTKTREIETGAKGVYAFRSEDLPGNPVYFGVTKVSPENLNLEKAEAIRNKIIGEFTRIVNFNDNSPELKEFNDRFAANLAAYKRGMAKFINTPPGFAARSSRRSYGWLWGLRYLNTNKSFRKSLTNKPEVSRIEELLASGKNFWREYIQKWKFSTIKPYCVISKSSPKLLEQEKAESKARADAEVVALKRKYGVSSDQEAIQRYKAEYDATTVELEKLERSSLGKFIQNPPLTLDDQLDYRVSKIENAPMVASYFDNMTGATSGIAFRTDVIPENELIYLSVMPTLLRSVGVIKDGKPLSYEETSEMLRKEILGLGIYYSNNYNANRYEMIISGSGNDAAESEKAIGWMKIFAQNPNWRKENLQRIRDVIDQSLSGLRNVTQGSEESWVTNPAYSYRYQDNPIYLSTASLMTRKHNFQRIRWMLMDVGDASSHKAISDFLTKLAGAKGSRQELRTFIAALQGSKIETEKVSESFKPFLDDFSKLPKTASAAAVEAAKDLDQTLGDIPDSNLTADWAYLCDQMRQDLSQTPEKTLAKLESLRRKILNGRNARMFYIGSRELQSKLAGSQRNLLLSFENTPSQRVSYSTSRRIDARLKARLGTDDRPVFVGFMAPNMTGGVFLNTVYLTSYADTSREKLKDYLASQMYAGTGPHSVYTKTLNAGLAYGNGVGGGPDTGIFLYYAERTPELPQTLKYVIEELKKPYTESNLSEYCIALSFYSRASSSYESRGVGMADDLADGITPEVVARFRRGILNLRKMPNLSQELIKRKDRIYEMVLPGYGIKGKDVKGANYFVVGPEKQMAAYENYLKSTNGADTNLYRLYPRDFWLTLK